ncbi:hypothetical protein EPUS_07394 [Endocarpon pusillum Z07020]|uniref:Uncharacterized protein n=1 Tax=Endocarpon pusillum (strain Z07020 / HMAS-L-300199) TaxID=1263415 RepID=U1I2K7_ENDPU|nr:uncharacterized protein EPUS_07394 [Endocarpon pusillum Z07020]ERF76194.1 hypothetical protein EPUS_07394 [Endocarpon pusillum Z07020]
MGLFQFLVKTISIVPIHPFYKSFSSDLPSAPQIAISFRATASAPSWNPELTIKPKTSNSNSRTAMFAKISRMLAGKKHSETKKAGKDPRQVEVTKRPKKSVGFENDAKLVQTIEVPPNVDKPATGEPPVLRKEKHPLHLGVKEQQPSCRTDLEMAPVAEGGSSSTMPSRAPPASFPNARIPGCDHHNTTLISTDMAGKSMTSFRARWVFSDGTSTTHTHEAAPFSPIMACPTSPFHGLDPLIPGTTIVNTSVISTDEAGNSNLRCRTTCMLLDGTSKTQTRDPVFIPASADKVGDPSPLSHATPAEGVPSFNDSSLGESSSIELSSLGSTSHTVAETANPQTQPTLRQPRKFYRQPWNLFVRKPKFCNLTPRPEEDHRLTDEAWTVILNRIAEQKTEVKNTKPEQTQPQEGTKPEQTQLKVSPTFDDILAALDGSVEERSELEGKKRKQTKAKQSKAKREKKLLSDQNGPAWWM